MSISLAKWLRKLSHSNLFYNDWLDYDGMLYNTGRDHNVNLSVEFFKNLKFDSESLKQYRIDSATQCAKLLGDNPALCLSGGIDSQAMVQSWHEAGLTFDTIIVKFDDELNVHDTDHAKMFCERNNYPYKEVPFNVVQFLNRDNYDYAKKYNCWSPHFNVHFRIVEILRDMGYTGVCNGGDAPYSHNGLWGESFTQLPFHFLKVQDIVGIPFQGSFLSYYPQLAWAIGLLTETLTEELNHGTDGIIRDWILEQRIKKDRYFQKVRAYQRVGFNVIPQETKFTGFELVKKYFENLTGDGWTFERRFRHPLVAELNKDKTLYKFNLTPEQNDIVSFIHSKNFRPTV